MWQNVAIGLVRCVSVVTQKKLFTAALKIKQENSLQKT